MSLEIKGNKVRIEFTIKWVDLNFKVELDEYSKKDIKKVLCSMVNRQIEIKERLSKLKGCATYGFKPKAVLDLVGCPDSLGKMDAVCAMIPRDQCELKCYTCRFNYHTEAGGEYFKNMIERTARVEAFERWLNK